MIALRIVEVAKTARLSSRDGPLISVGLPLDFTEIWFNVLYGPTGLDGVGERPTVWKSGHAHHSLLGLLTPSLSPSSSN